MKKTAKASRRSRRERRRGHLHSRRESSSLPVILDLQIQHRTTVFHAPTGFSEFLHHWNCCVGVAGVDYDRGGACRSGQIGNAAIRRRRNRCFQNRRARLIRSGAARDRGREISRRNFPVRVIPWLRQPFRRSPADRREIFFKPPVAPSVIVSRKTLIGERSALTSASPALTIKLRKIPITQLFPMTINLTQSELSRANGTYL